MSMTFSQITETIDRNCKSNSTSYPLADKVVDINTALDRVFHIIFEVGGTWQFDDSNHDDFPIITTNITQGQRDYTFTSDESGNLILEIQRVMVADSTGLFNIIQPTDVPSGAPSNYYDGLDTQGLPNTYEKNANGIFLDPIPDYSYANGLKVYISREGSYFTTSDTTKKPGFAGLYHEYLALRPSYQYAFRNSLPNVNLLKQEMLEMEQAIADHYKKREKDVELKITTRTNNSR